MMNKNKILVLSIIYWLSIVPSLVGLEHLKREHTERFNKNFTLTPPKGWECLADKDQLPAKVEIVYIGMGKGRFTPSLNLAVEETNISFSEYVELAKQYHESNGGTQCTKLGQIETRSGPAFLLQIDRRTQWGEVRFLQSLLMIDKKAYVLTATCLQEEFATLAPSFLTTIKSLAITPQTPTLRTP